MPISGDYKTFEVSIDPTNSGYRVSVLDSPAGETNGPLALALPDSLLTEWHSGSISAEYLGGQLFDAIFHGPVGEQYRASLARTSHDAGLRINLRLDAVPELALLPWELLYDTTHERFLALSERTPINRYLALPLGQNAFAVEPPLRALIVLASPSDYGPPLQVEEEWMRIRRALTPLVRTGQVVVERLEAATWPELQSYLRRQSVHILHFVGHGFFDRESEHGGLYFEDEDGFAHSVSARKLAHLLHNHTALRLILLNACEGAATGTHNPFNGVAQALVQQGIPAVIAMEQVISDQAALTFGENFYAAIVDCYPVDAALCQARLALYATDEREWATPVLFMRTPDGALFSRSGSQETMISIQNAVPAPPEPARPPDDPRFVGREQELAAYAAMLDNYGIAVIAGMVGVGKTSLAAQLAVRYGDPHRTFWHTFHAGDSLDTIIWNLAAFLAQHGKPSIWQMLHGIKNGGGPLSQPDVLLNYLIQAIKGEDYLICFDDFELVDEDPLVEKLADRLRPAVLDRQVKLLITSQRVPDFIHHTIHITLAGLTIKDSQQLLSNRGVELPPGLITELYARTEGNAELLNLAAGVLQQTSQLERTVERLAQSANVEQFLIDEVDKGLDEHARAVMAGVAVLLGHPATGDAIEEILRKENVRRTLTYLVNRYLLTSRDGEWEREYSQHALIQDFYYGSLSRNQRQEMHRRVADYYCHEESNDFKAALHYQYAGDYDQAIDLFRGDIWQIASQGRLGPLARLLDRFPLQRLTPLQLAPVLLAKGQIDSYLGRREEAHTSFAQAELALSSWPDDQTRRQMQARLARGMAFLLRENAPQEALAWAEKGLTQIAGQDGQLEANLLTMAGTIYRRLGRMEEARIAMMQALHLQSSIPTHQRLLTLLALGNLHFYLGEVERSRDFLVQAEQIGDYLHDHINLLAVWGSLAACDYSLSNWDSAAQVYEKAIRRAEEMGSDREQTIQRMNYGVLLTQRQDFTAAAENLTAALAVARQTEWSEALVTCQLHLAALYLDQEQPDLVEPFLEEARQLAEEKQITYQRTTVHYLAARLLLARGELIEAEAEARKALSVIQELDMPTEKGQAWRVLGQSLTQREKMDEAITAFEQSLDCFRDNPHETSLTQQQLKNMTAQSLRRPGEV